MEGSLPPRPSTAVRSASARTPALERVYPLLESGFERLLKAVENQDRLHASPDVEFCPLRFLAEHLMRNNPTRG